MCVERPPRSPGVDPNQLAAELQKVSQQQVPSSTASSLTALDKASASGASSAVPSPGQPGSPSVSKKRHSKVPTHRETPALPASAQRCASYSVSAENKPSTGDRDGTVQNMEQCEQNVVCECKSTGAVKNSYFYS